MSESEYEAVGAMSENRIVQRMPFDRYLAEPGLSQSQLKVMAESPRNFQARFVDKTMEDVVSSCKVIGTVAHAGLLEPEKLLDIAVTPPRDVLSSDQRRVGNAYKEWAAEQAGKYILTSHEMAIVRAVIGRARESEAYQQHLAVRGASEVSLFWSVNGQLRKGRVDKMPHMGGNRVRIVDIKMTEKGRREVFQRVATRLAYDMQGAWYREGCEANGLVVESVVLVVIEIEPPIVTRQYIIAPADLDAAHEENQRLAADVAKRMASGDWSEEAELNPVPLSFRRWQPELELNWESPE